MTHDLMKNSLAVLGFRVRPAHAALQSCMHQPLSSTLHTRREKLNQNPKLFCSAPAR